MIGDKEVIDFLIPTEGFLEHPTKIGDGKITLGSGLTDPKWRELYRKRGNKWSQEDNMMAVKEEVQKRRKWAEKNVPNWSSLPEASQDALLSYKYNYDFNSKNSPKLYKALKEKRFRDAAKQIDATSKDPAFREGLEKRRKKEQAWFLSGFPGGAQQSASTMPPYAPASFNGLSVWEEIQKNTMPRKFAEGGYLEDTPQEYIDALYPEEYAGDIKTYKPWEELSMREKADMMRAAVRNGITTLPEIREKYNEFASGGNLYGEGGVKIGGANATWIYYGLVKAAAKDGINVSPGAGIKGQKNFRVTSNYRPNTPYITINGKKTNRISNHYKGNALDIVPGNGTSWEDILKALHDPNSHISQWMLANNLGYLDERKGQRGAAYGRGSNIHIGPDHNNAVRYRNMMAKAGARIPAGSTTSSYQTAVYTKSQPAQYTGNYLDIVKRSIKAHEGWSARPYLDDGSRGNGWRSVGWGFNDSGFYSKYPQGISNHYAATGITKAQAEEELNWFLNRAEEDLRKSYGAQWDSFTDGQKAAILDTYYQQPASVTGKNSAFRNAILRGDPNAVNYLGVKGYNTLNTARRDMFNMPSSSTPSAEIPVGYTEESPFFFTPANPTVFFNPDAVQTVSREDFINQGPIVQQAVEEVYDPKKEARDNFEKFNMFMSFLNSPQPAQEESDFPQIVSSLTGSSSPYTVSAYADGGSIHIKPENRGKFTALKERTGHSATWFKENGTPAQKKMAIFALNSRHWKHGLGGNLFKKGGSKDSKKEDEARYEFDSSVYTHPSDTAGLLPELVVTPQGNYPVLSPTGKPAWTIGTLEDMRVPLYRSTAIPRQKDVELQHLEDKINADEFANRTSLTPERFLGLIGANVPLAAGALGTVVAAPAVGNAIMESVVNPVSDYIGGTTAGRFITKALTNPYVDTGLKSAFAGHGLNHWINEGIDGWGDAAMTALEIAPLGGLARPMWNAAKTAPKFPTAIEGVKYAYNRNPELANIGTLEDYIEYLKTVFPESKVRTLNYHMGPKGLQELKPSTGEVWNTNPDARGIYVSPETPYIQAIRKFTTARLEKPSAWTYMKRNLTPGGWNKANESYTDIYPVMIDTRAPLHTKGRWTWGIKDEKYKSLMNEYDAIVSSGPKWYENFNRMPETILPKTEQTLILGSDADAAGFRRFMSSPQITAENAARDIENNRLLSSLFDAVRDKKPSTIDSSKIKEALDNAASYKNSAEYKQLIDDTIEEFKTYYGDKGIQRDDFYADVASEPAVVLKSRAKGSVGGYSRGKNTISLDPAQIKDEELVPYHEALHWQRVGNNITTPKYKAFIEAIDSKAPEDVKIALYEEFLNSGEEDLRNLYDEFLRQKVRKVLRKNIKDSPLTEPDELAVYGMEAGKAVGVKPFASYPGLQEATKIINKAKKYSSTLKDIKSDTPDEIRTFWNILTGRYIPVVGAGIAATTLNE